MKKIVLVFYTAVFFMFLVSVFLEDNIPKNTVVIGNEGFSTKYFNMESHKEEIEKKLEMNHGEYFLKNHFGKWYDGRNGKAVPEEWIPMITYKDELGEEYFYDEGDGAEISFDEKFMKEIRTKLRRDNNSFQNTYEYKGWIYYNKRDKEGNHGDNKIFRIKKDGMAETNLQASGYIYKIEDGWIYYGDFWRWTTKTNEISKMRIDGSDKSRVFDYESEEVFFENHRKNYSLKERKIYQIENNGERKELINLLEYAPGFNVFHNGNYVYATNWSDILLLIWKKMSI